ncbi:peptidoglycan DD-metalloendopeptidase family protein [Paenibacillus aceti]|uniref:Peptidase M23 n=1 Tax=Paenibacillus aceti TaxID=1820010 RepID=A0ABQ1W0J2_9BACL|nr:peptidoglycan DD-metalloendopeptidase family protein [Paenibacillus aceti]GGG08852.1 peptidase M23 [Paenibacillus aceti]
MRGFRGKRWQLWRGKQEGASIDHSRPESDQEMSEHQEANPDAGRRRSKTRIIAISAVATIALAGTVYFAGQQYVEANMVPYYRVYVNGQEIGTIADEGQLQALYKQKEQEYNEKYPQVEMALHTEGITTVMEKSYKAEVNTEQTLQELDGMLKGYAKGVELRVDGKLIGIVKDQAAADQVLSTLQNKFAPQAPAAQGYAAKVKKTGGIQQKTAEASGSSGSTLESVKIKENVARFATKTDPNKVLDANEAVERILQGDEAAITYEVREGDTISSIAKKFAITQHELKVNNPGIKEFTLQIGEVLSIKAVQPSLTVRTVERVSEEIVTEPQIEVRKSDNMRSGESKVISEGSSGLKTVEYRITKENGEVIAEEWLGQEVTKKASPKIIVKGTKIVLGEGSGDFAWPVSGARLTSSFGKRWGRTHKGVDLVSSNKTIKAADDGVISFAGKKSGYGNCIIVDHKNGYKTLYGHLSKISVKKGEVVEKGTKIGVMGNTGRSTGTHLHFEIHKNGNLQNPLKYL